VPRGYLAKVLQQLVRAGLVRSQRGVGGGFALARPAGSIVVLEVLNAVDPIRRIRRCPLDLPEHRGTLCALHRRLDDAYATIEQTFGRTRLSELVGAPRRRGAPPPWPRATAPARRRRRA
jgi:Rrf2 family protein